MPVIDYINSYPPKTKEILDNVRSMVLSFSEVEEGISYGMPAYKYKGKPLVYYGAYKNHLGVYATPSTHQKFEKKLSKYKQGKGSVQFPYNQPIPYNLIKEMIDYKIKEIENLLQNL